MNDRNPTKCFTAMMVLLFLAAARPITVQAQEKNIELTPTISYMWGGSFSTLDGDIQLEDGAQYGVIISRMTGRGVFAELSYATLSTRATFVPYYLGFPSALDGFDIGLNVHYFQLGAIQQFDKGKAKPFLGIAAGAVLFHPREDRFEGYSLEDTWRFALSATGGIKIALSETVALRLQGRLFLPVYFTGGSVWIGTGGASVGASGGIPIVQGDVGAGLAISL